MTPASVPRLFPGQTIVCLASGPSLTKSDVQSVQGRVPVVAVSNTYTLAPWADVLFSCDAKWWRWHEAQTTTFPGLKYTLDARLNRPDVQWLRTTGHEGLELDPTGVRTGRSSGYQAINIAVHLGASRIVLLGYDMHGDHFFGSHPDRSRPPFSLCMRLWPSIVEPLKAAGVEVINATPGTALTVFPQVPIAQALPQRVEASVC
jgi:hypothetical protein